MKEDVAIENLKQVKNVLDKYNIEYWLDIGTLLGAVRDGKFISWDHDIDLGTWQDNTSKICQAFKQFRNKGFNVHFSRYVIRLKKRDCPLSIIMYQLENDYAKIHWGTYDTTRWLSKVINILFWAVLSSHYANVSCNIASNIKDIVTLILCRLCRIMPICLKEWAKKIEYKWGSKFVWIVPADYFAYLSTIKFYEMEFKIPARTEEYLLYRYGKDWRVSKKDWVTERDDGAVFYARKYFKEILCLKK